MRIVINLNEHGEFDSVCLDSDARVFIHDPNSKDEPIYELTEGLGKKTGVQSVTKILNGKLAACYESTGPWKRTNLELREIGE